MLFLFAGITKLYSTHQMKIQYYTLLLLLLCVSLTACNPGHTGTSEIAYIRDGNLYTADPDGSNTFAVVTNDPPVIDYNWSPDHRMLSYRSLDPAFAKTPEAHLLPAAPVTGQFGDYPSTLNTIGVDGGTGITTAFSNPSVSYSNAFWNSNSSRLIYRATQLHYTGNPAGASWWISQNDQPGGIALKGFPGTYSIPSVSYNTQQYAVLGNATGGIFTTTMAGTQQHYISKPLPDHPLPASLERLLWQPAHQNQAFLYAHMSSAQPAGQANPDIELILHATDGHEHPLAHCACVQFAWSPNGNSILYTSGITYTLLDVAQPSHTFTFTAEANAVPYWSPDSKFLLLDGLHTLSLIVPSARQQTLLLSDQPDIHGAHTPIARLAPTNALLQPVANSLWSSDSRHFLLLTRQRMFWQNHYVRDGNGLYEVSIDASGHPLGNLTQLAVGNTISQVGWTYQDPDTTFLY